MISLLLKGVISGTTVVVILLLVQGQQSRLAGLMLTFPVVTSLSFFFMSQDMPADTVREAALATLYSLPAWAGFIFTFYLTLKRWGALSGLAAAFAVWFVLAALITLARQYLIHA